MPEMSELAEPEQTGCVEQAPPLSRTVPPRRSLFARICSGSLWTVLGFGGSQFIRFAANIAVARVLLPDDFGLMGVITIVLVAMQMFSDIGIGPAIIQNKRQDATFLNTAWTMQIGRGLVLFLVGCAIAWPLAQWWDERLLWLLPVASVSAVFQGFQSTRWFAVNRSMAIGKMAAIELTSAAVTTAAMVAMVYTVLPNAWALVFGYLIGNLVKTLLSFLLPGNRDRLCVDRQAATELFHFGKWLFLSTVITWLAFYIQDLMVQSLFGVAVLGLFWIGKQLADLPKELFVRLGQGLGFPALSEVWRERPDDFGPLLLKMRVFLVVPINVLLLGLVLLGPSVFHVLYEPRFWYAGWVVQALAVNSLAGMLNTSYGHAYMSTGRTKFNMATVSGQFITTFVPGLIGYAMGGQTGLILGFAVSQFVKYPVDMMLMKRLGFWQWRFDAAVLVLSALLAAAALYGSQRVAPYSVALGQQTQAWLAGAKADVQARLGLDDADAPEGDAPTTTTKTGGGA